MKFALIQVLSFLNNPKDPGPPYKMHLYLGRDKLAILTITVYVNYIVYMYLYIDSRAQVFSTICRHDRCNAESSLSQGIG